METEPEVGLPDPGRLVAVVAVVLAALAVVELASQQYAPGAALAAVVALLVMAHPRLVGLRASDADPADAAPSSVGDVAGPEVVPEATGWSTELASLRHDRPRQVEGVAALAIALLLGLVLGALVGRSTTKHHRSTR